MRKISSALFGEYSFGRGAALTSLAVAAITVGSSQAFAEYHCSTTFIGIPATNDGVYLNFVTGASATSPVAGWDFNPYAISGILMFYASSSPENTTRYVGTGFGSVVALLDSGTFIDSTSIWAPFGRVLPGDFQAGVDRGYVGVAFRNEETNATNYGWVSLTTTGPTGFPAYINRYCYQDDGTGVLSGTLPISLQSYSID